MATYLLTIESSFRSGSGAVLLPYLEPNPSIPRDQLFEVELRGAHGVLRAQANARDSIVREFVDGAQLKTFIGLHAPPEIDLTGVELWLP